MARSDLKIPYPAKTIPPAVAGAHASPFLTLGIQVANSYPAFLEELTLTDNVSAASPTISGILAHSEAILLVSLFGSIAPI